MLDRSAFVAFQVEEVAEIAAGYQQRVGSLEKVNGDTVTNGDGRKAAMDLEEIAETTTSPHVAQGVAIERFTSPKARTRAQTERPFLSTMELRARQASMFAVDQNGLRSHADITKEVRHIFETESFFSLKLFHREKFVSFFKEREMLIVI